MSVYLSTNSRRLQQTSEESCFDFARQRGNVFELHNHLAGELQRQIRLREDKKRVLSTAFSPAISPTSKREEKAQRRMHLKTIKNRVPSASGREVVCERRNVMQEFQMGRHFCELLGPRLCLDCMKVRERVDAMREYEERPSSCHLKREPFAAFVCSHLTKQHINEDDESDEEMFDYDLIDQSDSEEIGTRQEKRYSRAASNVFSRSPPPTGDSGYSSRVSHIRGLTRAQSCSIFRNLPSTPFSPFRREKTHAPRIRETRTPPNSRQSSGFGSTTRGTLSREYSSESNGFLSTIKKIQKRAELIDVSRSWFKYPVEPVLMELKLINFTQYDKLGYEPPPPEPETSIEVPDITLDEFGFPIMENITVSST